MCCGVIVCLQSHVAKLQAPSQIWTLRLRACSHGGGGHQEGEVPHFLRSKKPGLHMEPQGAGVRFKMQSIFSIEPTKLIITLYSLRYLRRRSTHSGFHALTFGVFLLNFLADFSNIFIRRSFSFCRSSKPDFNNIQDQYM